MARETETLDIQRRTEDFAQSTGVTAVHQYHRTRDRIAQSRAQLDRSAKKLTRSEAAIERAIQLDDRSQATIDREIATSERDLLNDETDHPHRR
jgi:hypothetical protein